VTAANSQGWIGELIEVALAFHPTYRNTPTPPALTEFMQQHQRLEPAAAPPAEPDPFESLVMRGGRVFIARDDLRQKLKLIGTENFSCVLVVNGTKCSGKTYTRDFVNHLKRRDLATERVVYVDVDKEVNTPDDLLKSLGRPLGLQTIPARTSEQDAKTWVPSVGPWVRDGVEKKKEDGIETWWFILDGFSEKTHESTTYDLIRELATIADRDLQEIRLLLLNYGQRLGGQHLFVTEEKIEEIGEKEVSGFLIRANERAGKPHSDERLRTETTEIFMQVSARMDQDHALEHERLCYVSAEVTRKARQLFPMWMPS
jgi:hypothetical protein